MNTDALLFVMNVGLSEGDIRSTGEMSNGLIPPVNKNKSVYL